MIESIAFWENWEPGICRLFKTLGILLAALILALIVAAWRSPAPTVTWSFFQEREILDKPVHQFQTGPFSLQVPGDNIILSERLVGDEFVFQIWPAYLFLAIVMIGLVILTTVLSTVSRFWFFIGSGMLIFLLSGLQVELLNVLGQANQGPAAFLIIMIVGTGVAFQYYFQSATLVNRFLVFAAVVVGSFSLLLTLARVPDAPYLLAVGFVPSVVICCAVLAIIAAHEVVAIIIYLITRGLKETNGFLHVSLLTLIYLANLLATYLNDQAYLKWDYSLNPVLLLAFTTLLAIWGIRRQQDQMDDFLLSGPAGPLAIVGLGIIAAGASAFFYTTGNDAAVATISNMSLYAHISFGVIFLLYAIANFGGLLKEGYPVIRVLYKPKSMPFFTFRFAGSITMLGFILYNHWLIPIRDTQGARDAAMGDYYIVTSNIKMAEGFYEKSDRAAFHNHHANFVLANIEGARNNRLKERQYFLTAAERRPTLQAYMNAINTLDKNAINEYAYLQDVKDDFPNSGVVNNALGLVYGQLNQLDSAIIFFNLAKKDRLTAGTAELNLLATAVRKNISLNADSVYEALDNDEPGPISNTLALANKENTFLKLSLMLPKDSSLNLFTSSLINNYLINHIDSLDTALISQAEKLVRRPANEDFFETVLTSCALAAYQNGQVNCAFKLMQEATVYSDVQGKKNNIMALWALDQEAPAVALGYSQYATQQNYEGALLTQAITFAESGRIGEAVVLFDSIRKTSKDLAPLAESLQRILAVDKKLVKDLNDLEKYSYCRYRLSYTDSIEFTTVSNAINDPNWKARAILDRSKKLYDWNEISDAVDVYNRLTGMALSDRRLVYDIQLHELLLAAGIGNTSLIKEKLMGGFQIARLNASERLYLESMVALSSGDTLTLRKNLNWIKNQNSFFSDGVVMAASLEKQRSKEQLGAYNILADALQANPQSVKILKAYIQEAHALEFDDFAAEAIQRLEQVLPAPLFVKFMRTIE